MVIVLSVHEHKQLLRSALLDRCLVEPPLLRGALREGRPRIPFGDGVATHLPDRLAPDAQVKLPADKRFATAPARR